MNKLMKTIAAGTALFTLLSANVHAAFAPYSIAELRRDYPDLQPGFNDESLYQAIRLDTSIKLERDLHLQSGWTGDEYARAYANDRVAKIRLDFDVGSRFTRDQLVESSAAKMLERFIGMHDLPKHFSQADLIQSAGQKGAVAFGYKGQKEPLSAKEFAVLAGKAIDQDFINEWSLTDHWNFEELRATIGPERAARISRSHKIRPGMTHAEIVERLGKNEAARYAERFNLSTEFSADEAIQAAGREELDFVRAGFADPGADELNEEWLLKHARAEVLADLQQRYAGLQGNFTEQQLRDFLTKQADAEMRETYGFEGPYEEYDVAKAEAESVLAEIRIRYKLPLHFTEEQLNAAMADYPRTSY